MLLLFANQEKEVYRLQRFYLVFLVTAKKIYSLRGGIVQWKEDRAKQTGMKERKPKEHICARANCCIIYC